MIRVQLYRIAPGPLRGPTHALKAPYSERFIAAMHEVPGMIFDKRQRHYAGYVDAIGLAIQALQRAGGFIVPAFDEAPPTPPDNVTLPIAYAELREYQKIGVRYLVANAPTGALLADEMGLGKSAQAVRAARAFKRPTLIVCPGIARGVWGKPGDNQVIKWWPDAGEPRVLDGILDMPFKLQTASGKYVLRREITPEADAAATLAHCPPGSVYTFREAKAWIKHNASRGVHLTAVPVQLPPATVTVVHYEILYAWAPHLVGTYETLIIDEIHEWVGFFRSGEDGPKGPKRSAAGKALSESARHVIGLTGTPMTNLTAGFYNGLDTLCPGRFGSYWAYTERYCGGRKEQVTPERVAWVAREVTNAEELAGRIKYFMLRRTKRDVASELPARTRSIIEVDVPNKFAMKPGVALKNPKAVRKSLELASEGKIPIAVDLAAMYAQSAKGVVYTRFRRTAEEIAAGLSLAGVPDVQFIHGGVAWKTRTRRIEMEPSILVSTMDVLKGAISLTYATWALFAELHHNPQTMAQCEGRHHRIGQSLPVTYYYLMARRTLDEMLRNRVLTKLEAERDVVGSGSHDMLQDLGLESDEAILFKMFERLSDDHEEDEAAAEE